MTRITDDDFGDACVDHFCTSGGLHGVSQASDKQHRADVIPNFSRHSRRCNPLAVVDAREDPHSNEAPCFVSPQGRFRSAQAKMNFGFFDDLNGVPVVGHHE